MFLTLAIVTLIFLYVNIKYRYDFWTNRGIPTTKPTFLFGNIAGVGRTRSIADSLKQVYDEFREKEDFVGIYFFTNPAMVIINPELAKLILVKDFQYFSDRGMYSNKISDPLSHNLLTMKIDDWKPKRMKITPTFSSGKIKLMFDIISGITDNLVDKFSKTSEANISETVALYSTDIISNIAFGIESNCLADPDSEIRKYGKKIFKMNIIRITRFFLTSQFPELAFSLGIKATNQEASGYFLKLFIDTVKYREENNIRRNDFLQILIDLKNSKEGQEIDLKELASESFAFFGGGFETTSSTITYCLYELSQNKDIQSQLRDEVDEVFSNEGGLTYDTLIDMKYLNMVISETLRKYPVIPMSLRRCTENYKIPNTLLEIPKGTMVNIPALSYHHDPSYYPNPSAFDPERFTEENIKMRPAFTYLPFGEGQRICVGMRFAQMQVKIAIAKLISNFEFSTCEKTEIPMKYNLSSPFMTPKSDIFLSLKLLK
ncbi:hypothetical protein ACKWTF_013855 [Chironomus riparius]